MMDVLAWNTIYTHALHVYTPVAREWIATDDTAMTFVWDVFFAAIMLATGALSLFFSPVSQRVFLGVSAFFSLVSPRVTIAQLWG